jgi:hypothetical protein
MVVLTLTLGIGANSAIFSAVDAVLLKPLPYPAADRLVSVYERNAGHRQATQLVAPGRLEEWNAQNRTFEALGASYFENITDTSGPVPERVAAMNTSPRFFQVLDVAPALGRLPTPQEERFGGPPVIVISDAFWRRRFGADPSVLGRALTLGGTSRSAWLAIDLDVPVRLLDEAVHHAEPQPGSLSFGLGGEERLEHMLNHLRRHAASSIGDGQHDVLARHHIAMTGGVIVGQRGIARLDRQPAVPVHGVACIDGKVQQRVFDLQGVHERVPKTPGDHGFDLDAVAQRTPQQFIEASNKPPEVDDLGRERLAPAECQQLRRELGATRNAGDGVANTLLGPRVAGNVALEKLEVPADHLQEIVEVVRDATRELADSFHLLGLAERVFDLLALFGFLAKPLVCGSQFRRPLGNYRFERLIELDLAVLALAQSRLGTLALGDFVLRSLVQARIVMAMAACAAIPTRRRSDRLVKMPGCGWPKNSPPSTSPERDTTGAAR